MKYLFRNFIKKPIVIKLKFLILILKWVNIHFLPGSNECILAVADGDVVVGGNDVPEDRVRCCRTVVVVVVVAAVVVAVVGKTDRRLPRKMPEAKVRI